MPVDDGRQAAGQPVDLRRGSGGSRTTATRAVPIEPPTRWTMLMAVDARGTWSRESVWYAAAMAGIITKPNPIPRTKSDTASSAKLVWAPSWV